MGLLGPMGDKVKKVRISPVENNLNVTFHVVLVIYTDTGKTLVSMPVGADIAPLFGIEGMAVGKIGGWFEAAIPAKSFQAMLAWNGFY